MNTCPFHHPGRDEHVASNPAARGHGAGDLVTVSGYSGPTVDMRTSSTFGVRPCTRHPGCLVSESSSEIHSAITSRFVRIADHARTLLPKRGR